MCYIIYTSQGHAAIRVGAKKASRRVNTETARLGMLRDLFFIFNFFILSICREFGD